MITDWLGPDATIVATTYAIVASQLDLVDEWARAGQLGLGVLLGLYIVVQVLERILPYFKSDKQPTAPPADSKDSLKFNTIVTKYVAQMEELRRKVNDLHEWHNVRGPSGMHVWWTPVEMLTKIVDAQADIRRELAELRRCLDDLDSPRPST